MDIIIDSNKVFYSSASNLYDSKLSLYDLADKININVSGDTASKIFINVESPFVGWNRQDSAGIELLLWLRCKHGILNPVVLYGFQSPAEILRNKPEYLIIVSEGTYYYQLPFDPALIGGLSGVTDTQALKKFLKPAFNVQEFRHRDANWWGLKSMWDVYNYFKGRNPGTDYPHIINDNLKLINNCIAEFCYRDNNTLKNLIVLKTEEISRQINSRVQSLEAQLSELNNSIIDAQAFLPLIEEEIRTLQECIQYGYTEDYNKKREEAIILLQSTKTMMGQHSEHISTTERDIATERNRDSFQEALSEIERIINSLSTPQITDKSNFLIIDDMASDGWGGLWCTLIAELNQYNEVFLQAISSTSMISEGDISQLYSDIKETIDNNDVDIILLDVRLSPAFDDKQGMNVAAMTGPKLLDNIMRDFPYTRVIITTASQKVWTYDNMIRLGAEGYWVKEGVDDTFTPSLSVDNYLKIKEILFKASKSAYRVLRILYSLKHYIDRGNDFWWTDYTWSTGVCTSCQPSALAPIINDILLTAKLYFSIFIMENGFKNKSAECFYLSGLINKIGTIVEMIHNVNRGQDLFLSKRERNGARFDPVGYRLKDARNDASHAGYTSLNQQRFVEVIYLLDEYLRYEPDRDILEI